VFDVISPSPTPRPPGCGTATCISKDQIRINVSPSPDTPWFRVRLDREPYGTWPSGTGDQTICSNASPVTANITPGYGYRYVGVDAADTNCANIYGTQTCNIDLACPYCTLDFSVFPNSMYPDSEQEIAVSATQVYPASYFVRRVDFSTTNPSYAYVSPSFVETATPANFWSTLYSLAPGDVTIGALGTMNNPSNTQCDPLSRSLEVLPYPAWWQSKQGNLQAAGGGIVSIIPATCVGCRLIINDTGLYPGVAITSTGYIYTGQGALSSTNWRSTAAYNESIRPYDFNYFYTKLPSAPVSIAGGFLTQEIIEANCNSTDYCILYRNHLADSLTINTQLNIENRKVIVMANEIFITGNGRVNLTKGQGFFMALASDTLEIDYQVGANAVEDPTTRTPDLVGIYFAENRIRVMSSGTDPDVQLYVRGMLVSRGQLDLQRNLGSTHNPDKPAEFVEFAPDQYLRFPPFFGTRSIRWREVAP
jgi:hypothetical protein